MTMEFKRLSASEAPPARMSFGLALSALLHILAALLVFIGLPGLMQSLSQSPALMAISIDLVQLGPEIGAPPSKQIAALGQIAPAIAKPAPPVLMRLPQSPPPHTTVNASQSGLAADQMASLVSQKKSELPVLRPRLKTSPPVEAKAKTAPPAIDLQAQLQALAGQQQFQAQQHSNPNQQEGQGSLRLVASGGDAALSSWTTNRTKDFIRAQIERRWFLDRAAAGAGDFVVSLRLQLTSDGTVTSAEIVDGQGLGASAAYRSAASSLRDAALMSSPLALPSGTYDEVKDITLNFSPRDVVQ